MRKCLDKPVKTALLLSNVIDADHQNNCLFTNKDHFSSPLWVLCPYYTMRWVCVLVKFVSKSASKMRAKCEQNASKMRAKHKQNASKTQAKRKQNASKTQAKHEQNATDSRFCPTHSVIYKHFLALDSCF